MISREELNQVREKATRVKALVIGDAMIDRYIYGTVDRISPEAPVPVLTYKHSEEKAGGAANVALNLASWGCDTTLIGLTGKDSNSKVLEKLLDDQKIAHHLVKIENRPTTVKTRIVAASHHLLRIDEESTEYLDGEDEEKAILHVKEFILSSKPDLIILEDYNKGLLTEKIISTVIEYGKTVGSFLAVDPKERNFFHYQGVHLFKPNLREAEHASHRMLQDGDLKVLCMEWRSRMKIDTLAITLSSRGIYIQNAAQDAYIQPERSIDVIDVCGAGDAVICALALGVMSGLNPKSMGSLANLTGAYVCSHSGVVTVDVESLYHWI